MVFWNVAVPLLTLNVRVVAVPSDTGPPNVRLPVPAAPMLNWFRTVMGLSTSRLFAS